MDKNKIQKFAIWARTELITQVKQRAFQYGIGESGFGDASADTLNGRLLTAEEKSQRQELIKQIKEKGYQQVMEEVAYTWFNRFIALRFMEVNNYLPSHIRVFSDASGAFKPEILRDALHLELPGLNHAKVAEYIENSETEALYRYLLLAQCNALNEALPMMFERMGGYTEMLLPNNILRPDSVLARLIADIDEQDWTDQVQIIGWLYQYYNTELKDDTFAQLKKNVKITKERIPAATQLFTPDWIVRYMVENSLGRLWLEGHPNAELRGGWKYYLDEAEQEPEVEAQLVGLREEYKAIKPEEIKVIDPCMGSGHILVYAFDVLMQIYTSAGWDQREAAQSILKNNLFGLDIDDRAAQLAYFAVMMKARQYDRRLLTRGIQPNIYSICESNGISAMTIEYFHKNDPKLKADIESIITELHDAKEYGSILNITPVDFAGLYARFDEIREDIDMMQKPALEELLPLVKCAEVLAQKYDVVVTNPPYMNSSGMDGALSQYVSRNYEIGKYDLFSVMIIKCLHFVRKSGYLSLITMESWMFRPSFEKLRKMLLSQNTFISLIHMPYLGKGNNSMEISFGTAAFVIQPQYQENYNSQFDYIRYFELNAELEPLQFPIINERYVQMNVQGLLAIPGAPFGYWGSNRLCNLIAGQQLGSAGSAKSGMQTGNNDIFLRFWYEPSNQNICLDIRSFDELIERDPKWVPQTKGGDYRKWYGNHNYVVLSKDDFSAIRGYNGTVRIRDPRQYFVEGITWSHTSSRCFGARYLPAGFTFNVESPSFFSRGCSNAFVLGLLNSTIAEAVLRLVNQTMSYQSVDIERIPLELTDSVITGVIENKTDENVAISKKDWDSYETSWDFKRNPLVCPKGSSMVDDEKLFIDSHRQVIQIDYDMRSRIEAEGRSKYYHFCSLSTLDSILESRAIKLNNIGNFEGADEYERKNIEPEFWGQVFVACLTNNPNSKELWNDFGDNGSGVRIDFTFPSIFHIDVFDKKRLVRAYGTDGKEYVELGFAVSAATHPGPTCNPNRFTQPIVDISLMDVTYTDELQICHVFIDGKKALNMSSVSTVVPCSFWDEYETRVRGVLRCTHNVCISKISYLLVPINFKYVSLTFGKKVNREKCQYYLDRLNALKESEE